MQKILVLNGPNLNLLGAREPKIYGFSSLSDVEKICQKTCDELGCKLEFKQTNEEGRLVDWLQQAGNDIDVIGVVLNAAAYTHTSVAIHDAIKASQLTVIELHISNTHAREEFRKQSFITPVAKASIMGFGIIGYKLAIEGLIQISGRDYAIKV